MKILCVSKNYPDQIDDKKTNQLKKEIPKEPVLFIKPDTALLGRKKDFIIPEFTKHVAHEIEIVLKINKVGKYIQKPFAHRYYNEITIGIDFTARDVQKELKEKGLPWEKSKAFDQSAVVGEWISKESLGKDVFDFSLKKNGKTVQRAKNTDMILSFDVLIVEISKYFSLKIGDLIFTGTPFGSSPVKKDDVLEGFINEKKLLHLQIA